MTGTTNNEYKMNERIRELAEQARSNEYGEFDKEKFADLIIKECANVAHECIDDEWFDVGGAIKEHFGVK